jgi:hypothetical protein
MKNQYSHPHDALQYVALESGGIQAVMRIAGGGRAAPAFQIADRATGVLG